MRLIPNFKAVGSGQFRTFRIQFSQLGFQEKPRIKGLADGENLPSCPSFNMVFKTLLASFVLASAAVYALPSLSVSLSGKLKYD